MWSLALTAQRRHTRPDRRHLRFCNGCANMEMRGGSLVDPGRNRANAAGAAVAHRPRAAGRAVRQGRGVQSGRLGQGSAGAPPGEHGGEARAVPAGRHHRRGVGRQHRRRAGDGGGGARLSLVVVVPHGTSPDKLAVVRALGAEIRECAPDEDYVDVGRGDGARAARASAPISFTIPTIPSRTG